MVDCFCWEIAMSVAVVRLGSPRKANEGLRLGTVRRPPRGVPKSEYSKRNFYDIWLPKLSPTADLVAMALHAPDNKTWKTFKRKFRKQMSDPDAARFLDFLAALSHQTNFSIGCFCENEARCHRSVLRELLAERGADID
jgi:uncharacterized protein YeaO (DUF488 family)